MQGKSHTRAKSITFSDHTLHTAGFVHKMRTKDKIKTVRIQPVEPKKAAAKAYRNVSIAHIKNLRRKAEVHPSSLDSSQPLNRMSFFTDHTLSHALDHANPIKPGYDTAEFKDMFGINASKPTPVTPTYKKDAIIAVQSKLSIAQRQQFAIAKIRNPDVTLLDFVQHKGIMTEELREILEKGKVGPETKQKIDFEAFNFKPPRVMALDIGTQYIGVAISESDLSTSVPLKVIDLYSEQQQNADVESLVQNIGASYRVQPLDVAMELNTLRTRFNVVTTVVGLPQSDLNQHMIQKIQTFVANMQQLHGIGIGPYELCYVDEHHSTQIARKQILKEDEQNEADAMENELHSNVGQGGERRKRLMSKSQRYNDALHKKKGIDAQAAAIILDRFLELIPVHGPTYAANVQDKLLKLYGSNQLHTM